jgi:TrpR family transcriptional regulator, trp operon repressor
MKDFSDFVELVHSIRNKELLEDLLIGVTTEGERKELVRRVQIIQKLVKGIPQLQIAGDLNVGIATVTRGSKELSAGRFKALRKSDENA